MNSNEKPQTFPVLAFDLETTGIDVKNDRIVTACVVQMRPDGRNTVINWLADPGIEIPEGAAAVHGITTEKARAEGRPSIEVITEIIAQIEYAAERGIPVAGFNVSYDLSLLTFEARRNGLPDPKIGLVLDARILDKAVPDSKVRFRKGPRTLAAVAEFYGVALENAHSADADAIAAAQVARHLISTYDKFQLPFGELHNSQQRWYREQTESLEEYFHRTGKIPASESLCKDWPLQLD